MQDLQLALVISRLYESEFETTSTYKKILQRHVLGQDKQVGNVCTDSTCRCNFFIKLPTVVWLFGNLTFNKLQKPEGDVVILCIFQIQAHQDPFLRSMAHWVLEDYSRALDTLLEHPANSTRSASTGTKCDAGRSMPFHFFSLLYGKVRLQFKDH